MAAATNTSCKWQLLVLAIGLVIAFGLVLPGTGLFAVAFPITGVDGMSKDLHGFESGGFTMLTHNVLDAFGKPGIIAVAEDTVVPTGADGKTVEFDIILDNMLVVLHFEVVDSVFRTSAVGSMGPNWTRRVLRKADQSSIQSGVSSESRIDGSKYSRVVLQR